MTFSNHINNHLDFKYQTGILENINKSSLANQKRTFHQIKHIVEYLADKKEIIFIDELGTNRPHKPTKYWGLKDQNRMQKIHLQHVNNKSIILSYSVNGMIFATISDKSGNTWNFNYHLRYI